MEPLGTRVLVRSRVAPLHESSATLRHPCLITPHAVPRLGSTIALPDIPEFDVAQQCDRLGFLAQQQPATRQDHWSSRESVRSCASLPRRATTSSARRVRRVRDILDIGLERVYAGKAWSARGAESRDERDDSQSMPPSRRAGTQKSFQSSPASLMACRRRLSCASSNLLLELKTILRPAVFAALQKAATSAPLSLSKNTTSACG